MPFSSTALFRIHFPPVCWTPGTACPHLFSDQLHLKKKLQVFLRSRFTVTSTEVSENQPPPDTLTSSSRKSYYFLVVESAHKASLLITSMLLSLFSTHTHTHTHTHTCSLSPRLFSPSFLPSISISYKSFCNKVLFCGGLYRHIGSCVCSAAHL